MSHLGDYDVGAAVYKKFTTYRPSTGAAYTLGGTPAISVYKDGSATQSTAGVTLTADFDSLVGLNHVEIDTSVDGTFYSAGSHFEIVITTGTVDSVSVAGAVVGSFDLRKNSALKPTAAGRTLDVSTGGEAGIDWSNIGSPTTAVNLSATNIDVDQVVASVSGAVGSVTGNVGGNVVGSVASVTAVSTGAITSGSFAVGAIDNAAIAADAIGSSELAATAVSEIATGVRTELATELARIDVTISSRAWQDDLDTIGEAMDVRFDALDAVIITKLDNTLVSTSDGYVFSGTALQSVWDEPVAGHLVSGTTGAALNAAGSAGDPWSTALPGAYGAGTAGYIVGNSLDATVSSRASQTSLNTLDDYVDTEVAAIKAVTDKLDTTMFATSDGYAFTANALEFAPTGGLDAAGVRAAVGLASASLDTQLSAIDSKTTNLPSDPADQSLVIAATTAIYDRIGAPAGASVSVDIAAVKAQTAAIETDTQDLQSRVPAALVSGRMDASVGAMQNDVVTAAAVAANAIDASALATDAVAEIADAVWDEAISGHTSAGSTGLALRDADLRGSRTVIRGTVDSGASTTSIPTSAFSPAGASADQFKGRIVIFDTDTSTAALRGEATDITASTNSANPTLTVSTLSATPAAGDTFTVV